MPVLASSSWTLPVTAPVPKRARRGWRWRPHRVKPGAEVQPSPDLTGNPLGPQTPKAPASATSAARPGLAKQLALGLGIFAGILAASVPLVFISEGLALAAAVGAGAVAVALLARRLLIAPLVAALLAVLGAFATSHSVHVAHQQPSVPIRLGEIAPAAGLEAGGAPPVIAVALPSRAEFGGTRLPIAGWAFPAALFALWALGFGAIRATSAFARWLWRQAAARMALPPA
jgi:hypothetical protein